MKTRVAILLILILAVLGLSFELYRIEKQYLSPKVKKVEKEVVKKVGVNLTPEEVRRRSKNLKIYSRVNGEHFEVLKIVSRAGGTVDTIFTPFFVKGINFGPALPGTYPAQFAPTREDYSRWLREMGKAGFNAIRLYTVLPPDFYSALSSYNMKNSAHPIFLFQGIWVPVPDSEDYLNEQFDLEIEKEIEKAVDAIHGKNEYFVDVSQYTFGYIFGREWEPDGVLKTTKLHPGDTTFTGNFISIPRGNPMEIWLARMLDYIETYEAVTYGDLHPISFVNWLTLDPLYHISEFIESPRVREYDNDLLTVDPSKFYRTDLNTAGFFASYHIYPYYPDFINNEYRDFISRYGKDNYAGYLHALKEETDGIPILVAEFGVPSSRGIGHFNPFGMNQGGHTETEQGLIDFKLFRDIHDAGYAGGILFEWMDEWFKRNWLFMDFENPMSRNPLWHNIYDAEQTFGLVSFDPQEIKIDGNAEDWEDIHPILVGDKTIKDLSVTYDPVYLYILIRLNHPFNPDSERIELYLDTYDKNLGEFLHPGISKFSFPHAQSAWGKDSGGGNSSQYTFDNGVEFIIQLDKNGRVLVEKSYNVYRNWIRGQFSPMRTEASRSGEFEEPVLQANRERVTILGDTIPGKKFYPGRLIFGESDKNSLADWFYRDGVIELRLGWNLINVTDPSSLHVLQNNPDTPEIDAVITDGISFSVALFDTNYRVLDALPGFDGKNFQFSNRYKWQGWEKPVYKERLKASYFVLKDSLWQLDSWNVADKELNGGSYKYSAENKLTAKILPFMGRYRGFVSFSFDDGDMSQFEYAYPLLEKYGAKGSFGIVTSWLSDVNTVAGPAGELKLKRMSKREVKILSGRGHEISSHGHAHSLEIYNLPEDSLVRQFRFSREILSEVTGDSILTMHMPYSRGFKKSIDAAKKAGFRFVRLGGDRYNSIDFNPFKIWSFVIYNDSNPTVKDYYRVLLKGLGKWTVIMNHHIFPENSFELRLMQSHHVKNTYSILPINFEREVRIARDLRMKLVPIRVAGTYLENYRKARVLTTRAGDVWIVSLKNSEIPLFVSFSLAPGIYEVRNSLNDGIYEVRKRPLILQISPDHSTIISKIR